LVFAARVGLGAFFAFLAAFFAARFGAAFVTGFVPAFRAFAFPVVPLRFAFLANLPPCRASADSSDNALCKR
jgi:hypothetical protein